MTDPTPTPRSPEEAIAELLAGNDRYVEGRTVSTNPPEARAGLAAGQAPFAAFIRCADSRVAPELVFDQPLGAIFVTAIAGNVVTTEVVASLEYAVEVLGTRLVVVMGHSGCGAVEAAIRYHDQPEALPGSLPELIEQVTVTEGPADGEDLPGLVATSVVANANQGVEQLLRRSPVIAEAVAEERARVVAGVFDLGTGRFQLTRS